MQNTEQRTEGKVHFFKIIILYYRLFTETYWYIDCVNYKITVQ